MEALASTGEDIEWIVVEDASAPGRVRRTAAEIARRLGFSEHRRGEIAIVATELATNLHRHAVDGAVLLRVRRAADETAVEFIAIDAGPGVADLVALAAAGHSNVGTLGIGLSAAMRLSTWFDCHSVPGKGTVIVATCWRGTAPIPQPNTGALTRPMVGEKVSGDACAFRAAGDCIMVLLADGLGHGPLAAMASGEAVRAFSADREASPARALAHINTVIRSTRGAAAAVIRIDRPSNTLTFAGIGNVAAWIDNGERRQALVSTPGIVGGYAKQVREIEVPLPAGALIVVHSDGLTSKWDLAAYPGLRNHDPSVIAATLLRDAGIRHDDASIGVVKT